MRISDWSSDVCSSDLGGGAARDRNTSQPARPLRLRQPQPGGRSLAQLDAGTLATPTHASHARRGRSLERRLPRRDDQHCHLRDPLPRRRDRAPPRRPRSEEHTSELQSLMRISYAVFCLKKKKRTQQNKQTHTNKHKKKQ